jgi:uncharacterized repeat protein (TIGR03803 family)
VVEKIIRTDIGNSIKVREINSMKTYIKTRDGLQMYAGLLLAAGLGMAQLPARAQTLTTLHSFDAVVGVSNKDGALPYAALVRSSNTLYGTTYSGGKFGRGSIFAVNVDGTGFTNLHSFSALVGPFRTNADGANPWAALVLSGNTLYGTAEEGGHPIKAGAGTVYAINTDGSGFTNLHSFAISEGIQPAGALVLSGSTLYGTCATGTSNNAGAIFALNTDGSGYTILHAFTGSDGKQPMGGLVLSGTNLFGTTLIGGTGASGTIFCLGTNGAGFTNLHNFTATVSNTNSDGAMPMNTLTLSGNTLYGGGHNGGAAGNGVLFSINTDGTGFTNFHTFTALNTLSNVDGAGPYGSLFLSGTTLCGTAVTGGSGTNGTVFAVNPDGSAFTVLYNFGSFSAGTTNSDGAAPMSSIVSDDSVFGVTHVGGSGGSGTVFNLSLPSE